MTGVFGKIRLLIQSNLNDVLDKTIDLNSEGAVRQHIRELEAGQAKIRQAQAQNAATCTDLNRQISALQGEIEEANGNINLLARAGKAESAKTLLMRRNEQKERLTTLQCQLADEQETQAELGQAAEAVNTKHTDMMNQLRHLQSLNRSASGKHQAAEAMRLAGDLTSGMSVDSVTSRAQRAADVADAEFDQARGSLQNNPEHDLKEAEADAELAQIMANLNKS